MLQGTVLSTAAMAAVDKTAIAGGIPGIRLMENAGRAVTAAIVERYAPCPVLVLAGPGNNGGDGYVVARRLAAAGWPVALAALGNPGRLKGDAAIAAARWTGPIHRLDEAVSLPGDLVIDALFGAGLDRPLDDELVATLNRILGGRRHVVAVDVPSGVDGSTGTVSPGTPMADLTVTFCAPKPAHLLEPARAQCGTIRCADIGIPSAAVATHAEGIEVNTPETWCRALPQRNADSHKYHFGHALVMGGDCTHAGAAGMAAIAAARVGAGLVTVAAPGDALHIYAGHAQSLMTRPLDHVEQLEELLADRRFNAILIGPAAGLGHRTAALLERLLEARRPLVIDADGLTALAAMRLQGRWPKLPGECVLTPHEGEFARLSSVTGDRLRRARSAASTLGCTLLLKGADTVIATTDGRARINAEAPANLATAGTGDVLAGLITGLLAQGLGAFDAAAAAAWIHAEAARHCPTPMLATDLHDHIPGALERLKAR